MPVVDIAISSAKTNIAYTNIFVVEMTFNHDNDDITEELETTLTSKEEVIEFVNFLRDTDQYIQENGREPDDEDEEIGGEAYDLFQKWCNNSTPGLSGWPSDHNGNYFAELQDITITFYDSVGAPFNVALIEGY